MILRPTATISVILMILRPTATISVILLHGGGNIWQICYLNISHVKLSLCRRTWTSKSLRRSNETWISWGEKEKKLKNVYSQFSSVLTMLSSLFIVTSSSMLVEWNRKCKLCCSALHSQARRNKRETRRERKKKPTNSWENREAIDNSKFFDSY